MPETARLVFKYLVNEPLGTVQTALRQQMPGLAAAPELFREIAPNPLIDRLANARGAGVVALRDNDPEYSPPVAEAGGSLVEYLARARSFMCIRSARGDSVTITAPCEDSPEGTTMLHVNVDLVGMAASASMIPGARRRLEGKYKALIDGMVAKHVGERAVLRQVREILG